MVYASEGELSTLLAIHEMAAEGKVRREADQSYLSLRHRTGGGSPGSTAGIKIRIVLVVNAKLKTIFIRGQACRLEFIRRAGTVRFPCETLGRPLASGFFDITVR